MIRSSRIGAVALSIAGILLLAAPAFAGNGEVSDVPNDFFGIDDKDDEGARADLDCSGSTLSATARVDCDNGRSIRISTSHPDDAKGRKDKCTVGQGQKTNEADVVANFDDGDVFLDCDKAEVEVSVKTKGDDSGKFKGKAKNCTGLTEEQIGDLAENCAGSTALQGTVDGDTLKSLQIKGKGDAGALR